MLNDQCNTYLSGDGRLDARLFELSADCIKIIDLGGRIQRLNPGASTLLELDDSTILEGVRWESMWPTEAQEQVLQAVARAVAGESTQFGAYCPTAKGSSRWWDVIVYPVRDAQDKVSEIMAISRDVTELCQAREALREAHVQKDQFLLMLAHELRNPLSAAAMAAAMLDTHTLDPARVRGFAQVVARQISYMSTLVEDLIDLDRIARGELTLKLSAVDMRAIVEDAIEQVQPMIRAKRHDFELKLGNDACMVAGDGTRLIQAVGNLLGNAARYTPEAGRIMVTVDRENDEIHVLVTDNGIGMSQKNLFDIFERFTRVDPSSDRSNSGLGLGLSLVHKLVGLHGGTVKASSPGENMGSTFDLTLPAMRSTSL